MTLPFKSLVLIIMKTLQYIFITVMLVLGSFEFASAQYYSPYSSYYPYTYNTNNYYPNYYSNTYTYQDGCYLYEYNTYSRTTRLLQNTCNNQNYSYTANQQIVPYTTTYTYTSPYQNQNYYYNYNTTPVNYQYPSYIDASWSWNNGSAYFYYNDSPYYSNYNYSYHSYSNPSCRLQNGYFICY